MLTKTIGKIVKLFGIIFASAFCCLQDFYLDEIVYSRIIGISKNVIEGKENILSTVGIFCVESEQSWSWFRRETSF